MKTASYDTIFKLLIKEHAYCTQMCRVITRENKSKWETRLEEVQEAIEELTDLKENI